MFGKGSLLNGTHSFRVHITRKNEQHCFFGIADGSVENNRNGKGCVGVQSGNFVTWLLRAWSLAIGRYVSFLRGNFFP